MAKPDIDKVARALGASRVVDVSATPATGPLDWLALAEQVHQRLRSTGGRPTDPERSVLRQVRFTPEHWQRLEQLALQWSTDDRKVSPAQVDPAEGILGRLYADLQYTPPAAIEVDRLNPFIDKIQSATFDAAMAVKKSYFLH